MGKVSKKAMLPEANYLGKMTEADESKLLYPSPVNDGKHTNNGTQITKLNTAEVSRINALKEDLLYFRGLIAQLVQQKAGKLDYYVSIANNCNSTLTDNFHKMHQKYLVLLNKTQLDEAKKHLRALEDELSIIIKQCAPEIKSDQAGQLTFI